MRIASIKLSMCVLALAAGSAAAADLGLSGPLTTLACRLPTTARAFGVNSYYDDKFSFTIDTAKGIVLDESGTPMKILTFIPEEISAMDVTGRTIVYEPRTGEITASRYFLPGGEIVGLGHCNKVRRRIYK